LSISFLDIDTGNHRWKQSRERVAEIRRSAAVGFMAGVAAALAAMVAGAAVVRPYVAAPADLSVAVFVCNSLVIAALGALLLAGYFRGQWAGLGANLSRDEWTGHRYAATDRLSRSWFQVAAFLALVHVWFRLVLP
jgi:hypothetical protein